ncbi:MAG: hypothetical protein ABDH49_08025 [Candidatus Hydrothermales bacterium]
MALLSCKDGLSFCRDKRWQGIGQGGVHACEKILILVGKNEKSHTAQSRLLPILESDRKPTLEELEEAFSVEAVTREFFEAYKYAINEVIIKSLDKRVDYNKRHSFAPLLLSRILFIYFLQRKKWLKWKNYEQDVTT